MSSVSSLPLSGKQAGTAMPSRQVIRTWLLPVVSHHTAWALFLVCFDLIAFAFLLTATIVLENIYLKLLLGCVTGFMIGRLFILGHDACHHSFTQHRKLNAWLGRLVFLPSLTPYSLWAVGHNVVHHGYTNLKGFDFVWQPYSLAAFQALPLYRQWLEKIYRSGWAPWLYYLVEIWWKRLYFPSRAHMPTRRTVFLLDSLLVTIAALVWLGGLYIAAHYLGQSWWVLCLTAFVVPTLFWNGMIGFVVYVHHTHLDVAWYQNKADWVAAQPFVSTTVHLTFSYGIGTLLHHIMEHTAHHVDMSVPCYRLQAAQAVLEKKLPGRIVIQPFSWRWYRQTARQCKLYDFDRLCWTDFNGVSA